MGILTDAWRQRQLIGARFIFPAGATATNVCSNAKRLIMTQLCRSYTYSPNLSLAAPLPALDIQSNDRPKRGPSP
jgi:hypothetical protein